MELETRAMQRHWSLGVSRCSTCKGSNGRTFYTVQVSRNIERVDSNAGTHTDKEESGFSWIGEAVTVCVKPLFVGCGMTGPRPI